MYSDSFPLLHAYFGIMGKSNAVLGKFIFENEKWLFPYNMSPGALSIILTAKRTHWGITGHYFFTEGVCDDSPT